MGISFTESELTRLGFELVYDGEEVYLQLVLKPEDYINSPYLATESVSAASYRLGKKDMTWVVISPYDGAYYLTEEEVVEIKEKGEF